MNLNQTEKLTANYLFAIHEKMIWQRVAARLYMELHPEIDFDHILLKLDVLFQKMNDDDTWQLVEVGQ